MREKPLTEFMSSKNVAKEHREKPAEPRLAGLKGPWELPEGWKWVRLGEIVDNLMGGTPRTNVKEYWENGNIPWITAADITDERVYITNASKKITELAVQNSNTKIVPPETVLLVTTGATAGKLAIAGISLAINQQITALVPHQDVVLSKYLYYALKRMRTILIPKKSRGATFIHINQKTVKKFLIPLPPLSEQKRIVAKLDEVSKRLEEAKKLAREAREEAERLMASALHEVFSKAEERGWEWKKIEKIAGIRGNSGVKKKLSQFDSIAFIPMNLVPENGVFARYEIRGATDIKSYSYSEPGDILLAKITPSFENGKQGIVPENIPNGFALATTEVYPIYIKDTNSLDRMYLFYILKSKYTRKTLEDQMLGTTGRQRVPKEAVLKLKIPLPPLEEQKRIVAYLDSISERAQRLVRLYEEREKELEQLFPAVLDRAFRGEV